VTIILDSNFLFIPLKFGVDIFEEFKRLFSKYVKCYVPRTVLNELFRLRKGAKPSFLKEIDFAEKIAENCEILENSLKPGESVDESIIEIAKKMKCIVATNDSNLRKKVKESGLSVVYLRQGAYLEVEGYIE
jgi:rRNA-processing protein FCF1